MPTYQWLAITLLCGDDLDFVPEFMPRPRWTHTAQPLLGEKDRSDPVVYFSGQRPLIPVYTPEIPGSHCWLSYSILPHAPASPLYYFKIFWKNMHLLSWGVSKEQYNGKFMCVPFNLNSGQRGSTSPPDLDVRSQTLGADQDNLEIRVYRARGRVRCPIPVDDAQESASEASQSTTMDRIDHHVSASRYGARPNGEFLRVSYLM